MGCCYLSIRIDSNAPAANCVSQLVFFQCYQTVWFTISLCRLTGKNNTQKDTVLFFPLHPQLNPAVWAEKTVVGTNFQTTNNLKIINDFDNLAPQK